jgi:hypothetical protein
MGHIAPSTSEADLKAGSQSFAFKVDCPCKNIHYAWSEYARDGAMFRLSRNADGTCPSV